VIFGFVLVEVDGISCMDQLAATINKAPKSEFAMVAARFHDARIVRSGLVLRALLEDWSFAQITDALK
jgi:hypothetical protein